jgi:microsomal dipeptidase-like Zn-dependent dipeptidase
LRLTIQWDYCSGWKEPIRWPGDPASVRAFYERGVRAIMLTHLYNNALCGSSSPSIPLTNFYWGSDPGLSDQGRVVLAEMAKYGMVLDLAHASRKTFDDALAAWTGPLVVSDAAMAAIYSSPRNFTDEQVRAVAERNGIIRIPRARSHHRSDSRHISASTLFVFSHRRRDLRRRTPPSGRPSAWQRPIAVLQFDTSQ